MAAASHAKKMRLKGQGETAVKSSWLCGYAWSVLLMPAWDYT